MIHPVAATGAMSALQSASEEANAKVEKRIDEVGSGFESIFLHMLLEPLEEIGESFFGGGATGRTFGGLYRQQLADAMSEAKPLGIATMIEGSVRQQLESTPSMNDPQFEIQREMGQMRAQQSYGRNLQ